MMKKEETTNSTGQDTELRIKEHPILGTIEKGRPVRFTFDGKEMEGFEDEPIAAALRAAGVMTHRHTVKRGEPRGIFCAIGRCTDCVMVVDGKPNVRTCMTPLKEGMQVQTQYGKTAKPETAMQKTTVQKTAMQEKASAKKEMAE